MNNRYLIEQAADLLSLARRVMALTGAGLSTPSGVPDFRSPASGLWANLDVMEIASMRAFRSRPQAFYEWLRPLLATILEATPNPAHSALADLERDGKLDTLVTQNIDLLHSKAGSQNVYEIHGHLREVVCLACHYRAPAEPYLQAFLTGDDIPHCPRCHHVLKPAVVLFGDLLPYKAMTVSQRAAASCNVMIVAGTSLEVEPAASLPQTALAAGARLIVINKAETSADSKADLVIRGDVAEVLPALVESIRQRLP